MAIMNTIYYLFSCQWVELWLLSVGGFMNNADLGTYAFIFLGHRLSVELLSHKVAVQYFWGTARLFSRLRHFTFSLPVIKVFSSLHKFTSPFLCFYYTHPKRFEMFFYNFLTRNFWNLPCTLSFSDSWMNLKRSIN